MELSGGPLIIVIAACASMLLGSTQAHDRRTHVAMTAKAAAQSVFSASPYASPTWVQLGIVNPALLANHEYIDIGTSAKVRGANDIHEGIIEEVRAGDVNLVIPGTYSLAGWLMQGAVREDDNMNETPQGDEPNGVFNRVFGHFFDPVNDRGLQLGITLGPRAVDWALVSGLSVVVLPGELATTSENHFKISDAREAMWRALTLTARDANGFSGNVYPSNASLSAEALRQAYWATTFRALGDVIHLVQDMGQPQHTRNDRHSGRLCVQLTSVCLAGHDSFFEKYLRARTVRSDTFTLNEGFLGSGQNQAYFTTVKPLAYEGYPKPAFNSYADYFSTGLPGNSALSGYGLANYSNRGFYSFGTNINSLAAIDKYAAPSPTGAGLTEVVMTGLTNMTGDPIDGSQTLLYGAVHDSVDSTYDKPNVALSSYGIWNQFLLEKNAGKGYTLNHYNYDVQADLLIPRAVAYSAGLIDYFFRGRMDIGLPKSGLYAIVDHADFAGSGVPPTDAYGYKGFGKIRLTLRNSTPGITAPNITAPNRVIYPQDMGAGTLVAVAKFHRNFCYLDDLSGQDGGPAFHRTGCRTEYEEIVVSDFQAVDSVSRVPKEFEFTFSQEIPINAMDLYLQVVFRGALGQEADAVVVETKDISEPTYIAFLDASEYLKIEQHAYTHGEVSSKQLLREKVRPEYCIVNETLDDSCFVPSPTVNAIWHFYVDPGNVELGPTEMENGIKVEIYALPQRRFSRIAVLTNAVPDNQGIFTKIMTDPPYRWPFKPDTTQVSYSDAGVPSPFFTSVKNPRQTYQENFFPYLMTADGSDGNTDQIPAEDLTLPLDDTHPLRVYQITIPQMTP